MTDAITAAAAEVIPAAALQVLGGIKVVWEKVSSTVSERLQAAENELGRNARTRGLTAGGGGRRAERQVGREAPNNYYLR